MLTSSCPFLTPTSTDATTRVLLRSGIKKMRLVTKDEEAAAMSDFPVEEEEEKSDVVDEEGKGSFYESAKKGGDAVRETVKECSIVIEREIVLACPASFSELAKLTSRSCLVKLKSGLGYENPGRRLTRSMFTKLSNNFLNFIRKKQKPNEESCPDDNTTPNIRCRIISGKLASSDDTKEFLKKALLILHERFDPICESGTRGDLIPAMVYGEVIVSVGIFRVLGSELAELPLVATTRDYQGQGYFQCLFDCIERLLGSLNVKQLVLPAADEAKSIWTDKFGFTQMMEEEVKECRKEYSVMVFHGTSMLRKMVPGTSVADGSKPEDSMEE